MFVNEAKTTTMTFKQLSSEKVPWCYGPSLVTATLYKRNNGKGIKRKIWMPSKTSKTILFFNILKWSSEFPMSVLRFPGTITRSCNIHTRTRGRTVCRNRFIYGDGTAELNVTATGCETDGPRQRGERGTEGLRAGESGGRRWGWGGGRAIEGLRARGEQGTEELRAWGGDGTGDGGWMCSPGEGRGKVTGALCGEYTVGGVGERGGDLQH